MSTSTARLVLLVIALGVCGCDQGTKQWAKGELEGRTATEVIRGALEAQRARLENGEITDAVFRRMERAVTSFQSYLTYEQMLAAEMTNLEPEDEPIAVPER